MAGQVKQVYWALLLERSIMEDAAQAALDVAASAGRHGYSRIFIPYCRTDIARNTLVKVFLSLAKAPDDTLVMLDCDHRHPEDILEKLVARDLPVVGALAFRRGTPFFPCAFARDTHGALRILQEYPAGLLEVAIVGTGAIAIQRRVFDQLDEAGYPWPYFRYIYKAGSEVLPSEDIYFGECCEAAGIPHHLDTTLETPHITTALIDSDSWKLWQEDHRADLEAGKINMASVWTGQAK